MNYKVKTIPRFDKDFKRLYKKYASLKNDFFTLVKDLKENPTQGVAIGNNCYKIRLSISSKGKGKSGGSRVITHLKITDTTVFLLSIYDKSDKENITDKELSEILKLIP